jgi:hypothetical protein
MNGINAESEPLLFSWDSPRRAKLAILAFLALSLVAHAFCFYIFQVVYPPAVTLLPPPARVALITAASEEGRTLLRWIDAEDPAVAFTTHRPPEARLRALSKTEHVPSYRAVEPTLRELPPLEIDLRAPDSRSPGAVPITPRPTAPAAGRVATSVAFSSEFDAFGAPTLPKPSFVGSNAEAPEAIRFRVAVNRLGEIRYCFPLNSSGDPALDEQARLYLVHCRFTQIAREDGKPGEHLIWGIATIEWGSDITRPPAKPAGKVTP